MATRYTIKNMIEKLAEYVELNKDGLPVLKECCLLNDWDYDRVLSMSKESAHLRQAINKLLYQKEVNLEKGGILGSFNKSMVALLLRDMGKEHELTAERKELEKLDNAIKFDMAQVEAYKGMGEVDDE